MSTLHLTIFVVLFFEPIRSIDSMVSFNYTEIQKLSNSCPHLDTCQNQKPSNLAEQQSLVNILHNASQYSHTHTHPYGNKDRHCACDELCVRYGDCCIDAPGVIALTNPSPYNCFEMEQFNLSDGIGIYMKDSCLPSYNGPEEVRHLCESTSLGKPSDPLGSLPISDPVTGITFKNYYCSICNEKVEDMVLWTFRLKCPFSMLAFFDSRNFSKEYVFHNLVYQNERWGLYLNTESESSVFQVCSIDAVMPTLIESKIRLCKLKLVSDCPPDWKDDDIRTMCRSYMGALFINDKGRFKNIHCAYCNQQNLTLLSCKEVKFTSYVTSPKSLSLLLDINEGKGKGLVQLCEYEEVHDPFWGKCRSLMCLPGYTRRKGLCVLRDASIGISGSGDTSIVLQPETEDSGIKESGKGVLYTSGNINSYFQNMTNISYNFSPLNGHNLTEATNVPQNCLLISLADNDYVTLPNKSVYVPKYGKVYDSIFYYAVNGSIWVCNNTKIDTWPPMGFLESIGFGTSMVCLFLHFVVFWMVPDLRNLSGKSLMSQCVALFFGSACFIMVINYLRKDTACFITAFGTYYFLHATFLWMGVVAYDVWRTVKIATTELRKSSGKQIRRFIVYSLFAWGTPMFLACILALAEFTDLFPLQYRPAFGKVRCWFKRGRAHLVFFAGPSFLIMFINAIFYICSAKMILMTPQTSDKQYQVQRRDFKMYLRLALIMGLTWVIGSIAAHAGIEMMWKILNIFNTLHGVFIFLCFTCSAKVRKCLKDKLCKAPKES
ncbi:g-protein coupled receptor Mth2 [Nephila pilipes]|uniref:G-protein coupled receptor Mth2 n=1 Tax=Nephila pilipes TaxID=299642 RepID=A0A8X6MY50_NEPPI|nr:g-protein coupled receptor Mth2 [Nephila pilipes]GFT37312.1 g-protein coupled receptor Mth2 [Nephila pilipes]